MDKEQKLQEERYLLPYHYLDLYSDEHKLLHHVPYLYRINKAIKLGIKGSLIDIGCGDGRLIYEASKKSKYNNMIGTDYSDRAISYAKIINPKYQFYKVDFTSSKINNNKLTKSDNLFCLETLEHIQINKINIFLKNCSNLLNKNGLAIFSVPSNFYPCEPKHYQHFTHTSLLNTLNMHFDVLEIIGLDEQKSINKILLNMYFRISKIFYPFRHIKFLNSFSKFFYKNYFLTAEGKISNCSGLMAICKLKKNET